MKKHFFNDIKELFHALLPWIMIIILVATSYFVAYQIAVSNLPPWFKFFLLRAK